MAEARRLDPTQRAAAADAPVQLTLAGPGAGKTTTLAVRFVHLVRQGVDPRRILAVTFTRKAAIEMQDRIVRLLRLDGPKGLAVDTFHAFAFRHLRRQPQRFGLPEQFRAGRGARLTDASGCSQGSCSIHQPKVEQHRRDGEEPERDYGDAIGGRAPRASTSVNCRSFRRAATGN